MESFKWFYLGFGYKITCYSMNIIEENYYVESRLWENIDVFCCAQ